MNKVFFMGRVTKDLTEQDLHYTSGENAMCIAHFSLAVDKRFKNKSDANAPTADFFRITAFGKLGEFCKNYLKRGTKIVVEGRIENNNYTDSNGKTVYRDQIIAENIEFAESKNASAANNSAPATNDDFMSIPTGIEQDLPFK